VIAGFYPTTVFYLSLFYTRYEFAQRLGIFYGQYAVAGAFGGLVSYVVFSLFPSGPSEGEGEETKGGWQSYQVLFVLEGIFTILVAIITLIWLPTGPGTAWWLTPSERTFAEHRVLDDRLSDYTPVSDSDSDSDSESESTSASSLRHRLSNPLLAKLPRPTPTATVGGEPALTRTDIFLAFTDTKIWFLLFLNILSSIPATAFSIFLPLVLSGLGHTPLAANALTIPPFLLGACTLWTVTYYSDLHRVRIPYILFGLCVNTLGLLLALLLPDRWVTARYLALCVLLAGSYIASPLTVAWISGNIRAPGKRAVVLGINGWGNLAGVVAGWLFAPRFAPGYKVPLGVTLVAVVVSGIGYAGFWARLRWENRYGGGSGGGAGTWRRWLWRVTGGEGELKSVGEDGVWGL